MDIVGLIIQLIAGAVGGNVAGSALKDKSLGTAGNSIAGAIGGLVLAQIIQRFTGVAVSPDAAAAAVSNFDVASLLKDVIGGGAGGAILTAIVGMIKNR
jgi:uncharacterized membrane protein YeaQ/YmgE (transglycosylase-associated protein family)